MTRFPVQFRNYATGRVAAEMWFDFQGEPTDWEAIEATAGQVASRQEAEMDIWTGAVTASGEIVAWERAGVRVMA